jgi:hypothetical protein
VGIIVFQYRRKVKSVKCEGLPPDPSAVKTIGTAVPVLPLAMNVKCVEENKCSV